ISTLLGAADIKGQFDLGLEWTASAGLRIRASGGIEIALPIHMQLGPIEFQTVYLILRIQPDGTLSLETSTAFKASLGPLTAVVDRIGAQFDIQFVDDNNGAFGPFNLSLKFKPRNGEGLAIDAGVIRDAGFLFIDPDR